jgi:phage baseplate assembly protein W
MAVVKRTDILGKDLKALYRVTDGRHEDLDYTRTPITRAGKLEYDLTSVAEVDNAVQAVIHRINTARGELTDLGHPEYGSRHHQLIGEPNSEHNRNLVKLYILQALALEPRIEKILSANIVYDRAVRPDQVGIALTLSFIGLEVPVNLVIPFSFGGTV